MKPRNVLIICLITLAIMTPVFATGEGESDQPGQLAKSLPRNETLYVNGFLWGPPSNFNPLTSTSVFPVNYTFNYNLIYETLFMYNQLTGESEPFLGTEFKWLDETNLQVKLNSAAKFSDGENVTSEDVKYSYELSEKYAVPWASYAQYIDKITAPDDTTVVISVNKENKNPLFILESLNNIPIVPEHIWAKLEEENNNDFTQLTQIFNEEPVGSGPYKIMYYDDTRLVCIRNDNYWGVALFGKLPAPKYITHIIYKSNDAGTNAFRQHEVDVSQQFINQVWKLWENGEPYKTYFDDIPYYLPATFPHLTFNMTKEGLGEYSEIRKAIAMSINYSKIAEVAMSNYSSTVIPTLMLQAPSEQSLINESQLSSMLYTYDVDGANELLDSIGAKLGADGIRVLPDGTRMGPWEISCPYGWSDWNASLEIVAQCAKEIGIELRTNFPEYPTWFNDMKIGNFDIGMWMTTGPGISQPWNRAYDLLNSAGVPPMGEALTFNSNYGRYENSQINEILSEIPTETNKSKLKELYTELNKIYLEDLPHVSLMYRPGFFYTVYEGVWTGFPDAEDNQYNIPPSTFSAAFIKTLYHIRPVK